jgi:AraC-like DNA-binding protein
MGVSGLQTRLYPVPFPATEAIVFQLRPGAGRALELPMKDLANQEVDVDELSLPWGRDLAERVASARDAEQRASVLSAVLARELHRRDAGAGVVRRAGAFAAVCQACGRTENVARRIGYSERQLRRTFLDLFGVNPKELSSAVRMNAVLNAMSPFPDWAEAAQRHGYYDQSHLISDFHRLVGNSPERFARTLAVPVPVGGAIVARSDDLT